MSVSSSEGQLGGAHKYSRCSSSTQLAQGAAGVNDHLNSSLQQLASTMTQTPTVAELGATLWERRMQVKNAATKLALNTSTMNGSSSGLLDQMASMPTHSMADPSAHVELSPTTGVASILPAMASNLFPGSFGDGYGFNFLRGGQPSPSAAQLKLSPSSLLKKRLGSLYESVLQPSAAGLSNFGEEYTSNSPVSPLGFPSQVPGLPLKTPGERIRDLLVSEYGHGAIPSTPHTSNKHQLPSDSNGNDDTAEPSLQQPIIAHGGLATDEDGNASVDGYKLRVLDGFNWRKYGQKKVKDSKIIRSYYRCTDGNCTAKRKVERNDTTVLSIVYEGKHSHDAPCAIAVTKPTSSMKTLSSSPSMSPTSTGVKRASSDDTTMQADMRAEKRSRLVSEDSDTMNNNKVKGSSYATEGTTATGGSSFTSTAKTSSGEAGELSQQAKDSKDYKEAVNADGYHWRKYGHKHVRGNAYPRSYYKCANLNCRVRKYVERSALQPTEIITSYEGTHNHPPPRKNETKWVMTQNGSVSMDTPDKGTMVRDDLNTASLQREHQSHSIGQLTPISSSRHLSSQLSGRSETTSGSPTHAQQSYGHTSEYMEPGLSPNAAAHIGNTLNRMTSHLHGYYDVPSHALGDEATQDVGSRKHVLLSHLQQPGSEHTFLQESAEQGTQVPETIGSFKLPAGLTAAEKQQIANMTPDEHQTLVQQLKRMQQGTGNKCF